MENRKTHRKRSGPSCSLCSGRAVIRGSVGTSLSLSPSPSGLRAAKFSLPRVWAAHTVCRRPESVSAGPVVPHPLAAEGAHGCRPWVTPAPCRVGPSSQSSLRDALGIDHSLPQGSRRAVRSRTRLSSLRAEGRPCRTGQA